MTIENINKPNPKHYKIELTNIPVIIDGKEVIVDSLQLETRYVLKDLLNDANLTHEQAFWYGNIGKRYFRLCKKHDEPTTDIKKIIQEAVFLLSSILGKEYKAKLLDEQGNDLLNEKEERIATIGKLHTLLNFQEVRLINRIRNIQALNINGICNISSAIANLARIGKNPFKNERFRELIEKQELTIEEIKELIDILGDLAYGE
nr:MAG TPA: hypothetical protein [Caudoviricetes sp.]